MNAKNSSESPEPVHIGVAADHGGFNLKEKLAARLRDSGYRKSLISAQRKMRSDDDYPDFVIPLSRELAAGKLDRAIAVCGSGVGASICANKIKGVSSLPDRRPLFRQARSGRRQYEPPLSGWPYRGG